jgi:glycerol kinase
VFVWMCVQSILEALNIPVGMLPQIRSSSEVYTNASEGGLDGQSSQQHTQNCLLVSCAISRVACTWPLGCEEGGQWCLYCNFEAHF